MNRWKLDIENINKIKQVEFRIFEGELVVLKFYSMEMVNGDMVDGVCVGRGQQIFEKYSNIVSKMKKSDEKIKSEKE